MPSQEGRVRLGHRGRSRPRVQRPRSGSGSRRARRAEHRAARAARRARWRGRPSGSTRRATQALQRAARSAGVSPPRRGRGAGRPSRSCSGMPTGQTSSQAPHRLEACGELAAVLLALEQRRQHRADGAAVDPAVGVAADLAVDRADVLAGAAADAAQHVLVVASRRARRARCRRARGASPRARRARPGGAARLMRLTYVETSWPVPRAGEQRDEHRRGRRAAARAARCPSARRGCGAARSTRRALPSFVTAARACPSRRRRS